MEEEMESEKELEVAEPTEEVEETTINDSEVLDEELNFKEDEENLENSVEDNQDDISLEDSNEEKDSNQPEEDNSKYAAARRKAEEEAKIKIDEAYRKGRVDAYRGKVNPYTNTEIKDITDIEVYEDMYKLAQEGKDPLKDFASYVADKKREEARLETEAKEKETKAQQEIEDFTKKYPDVNLSTLLKDETFMDYADGKNKSLVEVYESFDKLKRSFRNKGIETAKKTIANIQSSPGSLNNSTDQIIDYETMSKEQFEKELEKAKEG